MLALSLLVLVGCGSMGLSFLTGGKDAVDTGAELDTGPPELPPVEANVEGRTWVADVAAATISEPQGLAGLLMLLDSTDVLFHVDAHQGDSIDLVFALTDAEGHQDVCQPVLDFSGADFSGNPWLVVDRTDVSLRINGQEVTLRNAQLELRVETYGQGFEQGWLVAEIDGRELDDALGDRIDSTVCELLDAMDTDCHSCSDGAESCFFLRIEDLDGNDYGGPFDPNVDPRDCE
jgi:hypothetical protein